MRRGQAYIYIQSYTTNGNNATYTIRIQISKIKNKKHTY